MPQRRIFIAVGLVAAAAAGLGAIVWSRPEPSPVGELDGAWQAVVARPNDAAAWGALGDAQTALDQLEEAEHAYRTSIRLGGGDGLAFARLGFLLYARGEDAEAATMLREAKRRGADVPMLDQTLAELGQRAPVAVRTSPGGTIDGLHRAPPRAPPVADAGLGGPRVTDASVVPEPEVESIPAAPVEPEPELSAEPMYEVCVVPVHRPTQHAAYQVDVHIGAQPATLIVDTGASMTVLSGDLIRRLGIRSDPRRPINAMTANGRTRFETAMVRGIQIGDRVLETSRVAICEQCGVEIIADGLLGLDLQAAFGMDLDFAESQIRFRDCAR